MGLLNRRQRKVVAPIALAAWLFALGVSVAHACGLDEGSANATPCKPVEASTLDKSHDQSSSGVCDEFCAEDLPLLAKLKAVQDQPSAQTLLPVASAAAWFPSGVSQASASLAPPSPSIAVNIRFVRLAL